MARKGALFVTLFCLAYPTFGQGAVSDRDVQANVLKVLAGASELVNESITIQTVSGVVTLSGSVEVEALRRQAELLAANVDGVQKVIDELRLRCCDEHGDLASAPVPAPTDRERQQESPHGLLQSDGTYASSSGGNGAQGQAGGSSAERQASANPPPPGYPPSTNYPPNSGYPSNGGDASSPVYAPNGSYPNYPGPPGPRGYGRPPIHESQGYGGDQVAGQNVLLPAGTWIRVRMLDGLSSDRSQPGARFDGVVLSDVVAMGAVAIPRGATVQGVVVDAKGSGVVKGRGQMSLALTQLTLGGKTYTLASDLWSRHGGDKTIETVNKTAGLGAAGAVIGAIAGGGVGAAVGGGIGAAAGLGSSAASGNGQVVIPPETILIFYLAEPAEVATVSEQELQRLAYGVAPSASPQILRQRVPRVYVVPGYYPRYYSGYYPGYYPYWPYAYSRY